MPPLKSHLQRFAQRFKNDPFENKELEQAFKETGLLLKKHGVETEYIESQTRENNPKCTIRWNLGGVLKGFAQMKERGGGGENEERKRSSERRNCNH
ncbi:uncharacterized protein EAF01_011520 [Botrytis porri]|uniref:uncharacterized protein n=1 Tax=Botrytis porri TaxID=87229 RepID=UPI00190247A3|nr:uncharacterized protein EAF01_011520 [Botrytis porri]KAF7884097.1 hypothetical protein EAF01_011520 [Botrytis porri]